MIRMMRRMQGEYCPNIALVELWKSPSLLSPSLTTMDICSSLAMAGPNVPGQNVSNLTATAYLFHPTVCSMTSGAFPLTSSFAVQSVKVASAHVCQIIQIKMAIIIDVIILIVLSNFYQMEDG